MTDEKATRTGQEDEAGPAGISLFKFDATGPAGEPVTQAAGHPHFLTTSLLFNTIFTESLGPNSAKPVEPVKDLVFYLPLGLLGDPNVVDPCSASLVEVAGGVSGCPPSSRVGTILPMILSGVFADTTDPTHEFGIYNVAPEKGYAAEFAFAEDGLTFFMYASVVRHDGTYMVRVGIPGVPVVAAIAGVVVTFYGDIQEHYFTGGEEFSFDRGAFLTDPSDCGQEASAGDAAVQANTWSDPDPELPIKASVNAFPTIEGCESLKFSSPLRVRPETTRADESSGYEVGVEVPQAPTSGTGYGTPPVREVSLSLPEGTTVSPSYANGLQACQETGLSGINIEGGESEAEGADGLEASAGALPVCVADR